MIVVSSIQVSERLPAGIQTRRGDRGKNVSAWFHTGAMTQQTASTTALNAGRNAEYLVSYFDPETGSIGQESFEVLAEAERFADSKLSGPECWATVDLVLAAAEGRLVA
jgi:hypothetical protein